MINIYCDGLCEPRNPGGIAAWAFVVYSSMGMPGGIEMQNVHQDSQILGEGPGMTNNVAEYTAFIEALQWCKRNLPEDAITFYSDSQLVVRQLNGSYAVRSPRIIPLYERLKGMLNGVKWMAKWIPREENSEADKLAFLAYNIYCLQKYGKVPRTIRERLS